MNCSWMIDLRLACSRADMGSGQQGVAIGLGQHVALRLHAGAQGDVTLGADMRLGSHVAAWATLSQADNLSSGENTLYLMGVSANF